MGQMKMLTFVLALTAPFPCLTQDTVTLTAATGEKETTLLPSFLTNVFGQAENQDPFSDIGEKPRPGSLLEKLSTLVEGLSSATAASLEREGSDGNRDRFLADMIQEIAHQHNQQPDESLDTMIQIFWNATKRVHQQLERTFKDCVNFDLHPLQAYYHMLREEAEKNPVFKRAQHAYMPSVPLAAAMPMADGLFLSQLAYVDECEHIREHLQSFHNDSWALLNCTVTGKPSMPAHFLAIRKVAEPLPWNQPAQSIWERILPLSPNVCSTSILEVVLVIRGSKEVADLMSDAMLEPAPYTYAGDTGMAHDGIMQSAVWLVAEYKAFLANLLQISQRSKIKLWLVGHSLGAGTAALAAVEFNQHTSIDAHALGFGTPAVLSRELSDGVRDFVTTVINDADCVPRMSGATLVNAWLKAASSDHWVDDAQRDIRQLMEVMKGSLPFPGFIDTVMGALLDWLALKGANIPEEKSVLLHAKQVLIPPGECVHLYRDGTGWQAAYMQCSDFHEIEAVRHLVTDHLIPTGYYRGLLGYVRGLKNDMNWRFEPDLINLPMS